MRIKVQSPDQPEFALYNGRSETRLYHMFEPEPGLFIAESAKVAERALGAGYRPVSLLLESGFMLRDEEDCPLLAKLLKEGGSVLKEPAAELSAGGGQEASAEAPPVYEADPDVLSQIAGCHLTGGLLCAMRRRKLPSADDILSGISRAAVLENVVNPTNVGAIVRSAAAMGMDAVLLTGGCADPLYRRAIRVSMGCIFEIPWTVVPSPDELFACLKAHGFVTAAMALEKESVRIDDPRLKKAERLALFLGNEGDGLPPERIRACDYTVMIPMHHGVDSLNVAAASAVAFWECRREGS